MRKNNALIILFILLGICGFSKAGTVLESSWSDVVRGKCSDQGGGWWSSSEAIRIAGNVLLYQKDCGGWPKNINIQLVLTESEKSALIAAKPGNKDCTIDNGAVDYELTYLSKVYDAISDDGEKATIKAGFQLGIQYLLNAQYDNGGWPQYYPYRGGYSDHITYNDNAMIHVLNILKHVFTQDNTYAIVVADSTIQQAEEAYNKGIECILNTQYLQNGKFTVWCAQHHYVTLEPVMARSYELASLSGQESAGIISFLMSIENPSKEIKRAIYSAVKWYEEVKITGQRLEKFTNNDGLSDLRIVNDPSASPLWARFYTLEDSRPFFCDRDGIMKFSLAEIGYERRNGYSWYNTSGNGVASANTNWLPKWGTTILTCPFQGHVILSTDTLNVIAFANKYTGSALSKFELILDSELTFNFSSAYIDTFFNGLDTGMHTIVVKSIYANDYTESDTVQFKTELPRFILTVNKGKGSGAYHTGSIIQIAANPPTTGKVFDKWIGDTVYIENMYDSVTTLTIPGLDIKITASYKDATGIRNEQFTISGNICYPNPVYEYVTINLNETGDAKIEIFDIQNRKVFSEMKEQGVHAINMDFLVPGTYVIQISGKNNKIYVGKLLVTIKQW